MKQGRYSEALPLLEQAVPALRGAGPSDLAEGYANYNLGYTLLQARPLRRGEAVPRPRQARSSRTERRSTAALDAVKQCEAAKAAG